MPGDNCSSDENVCSGDSWCREGKCRCLNGYEPFRGKCRHNYLNIENKTNKQIPGVQYHWKRLIWRWLQWCDKVTF